MNGVATVVLLGTVTADAQGSEDRAWFSVAVNTKKDRVSYFDVTALKNNATFAQQYLRKGTGVYIEGSMEWYEKADKTKRLSINVNKISVVSWPRKDGANNSSTATFLRDESRHDGPRKTPAEAGELFDQDDVPF